MKLLIATLLTAISINAGFARPLIINGRVCDHNDKEDLVGATIRLLSLPDSAFISASSAYRSVIRHGEEEITSSFTLTLPSRESTYLLEVSAMGYDKDIIKSTLQSTGNAHKSRVAPNLAQS